MYFNLHPSQVHKKLNTKKLKVWNTLDDNNIELKIIHYYKFGTKKTMDHWLTSLILIIPLIILLKTK